MAYHPGDWKVYCDRCGFVKLRSQCLKEENGAIVCWVCYDGKHPLEDRIPGLNEKQTVPEGRPEPADVFLDPGDVTAEDL